MPKPLATAENVYIFHPIDPENELDIAHEASMSDRKKKAEMAYMGLQDKYFVRGFLSEVQQVTRDYIKETLDRRNEELKKQVR